MPEFIFTSDDEPQRVLIAFADVNAATIPLLDWTLAYRKEWHALEESMFPHLKAERHRAVIQRSTCPEEMQEHGGELSTNLDPRVQGAISDRAKTILRGKIEEGRPLAKALVEVAEREAERMHSATVESEIKFLAGHGCGWERTQVSARVERLRQKLAHLRNSLEEPSQFNHTAPGRHQFKDVIAFFSNEGKPTQQPPQQQVSKEKTGTLATLTAAFAGIVASVAGLWPK